MRRPGKAVDDGRAVRQEQLSRVGAAESEAKLRLLQQVIGAWSQDSACRNGVLAVRVVVIEELVIGDIDRYNADIQELHPVPRRAAVRLDLINHDRPERQR